MFPLSSSGHPTHHFPTFYSGSIPHIRHPAVQEWTSDLMRERREVFAERGEGEKGVVRAKEGGPEVKVGEAVGK